MSNPKIVKQDSIGFSIVSDNINSKAVEKVTKYLPELEEKTKAFNSQNSQTTLTLMTLTMLGGQSPYRMLRQIMAEVEKRKNALCDAQLSHARLLQDIKRLQDKIDPVHAAQYRQKCISITMLENKINGSFKDIATLIDAYHNIKEKNNIKDWDEESFEKEEKRHHVRRGFEMMYRNLLESQRVKASTIEYLQQYGIHPQVCNKEVSGYLIYTEQKIAKGDIPHANDLEEFLDQMGEKYYKNVDKTSERLFGKPDITNKDFMYKTVTK
tara:strand:- start:1921 stop:2724 length:804 start_codon:yes stop_codon:yes gene_type:complete